jgi:hypothetical protein
MRAYLARLAAAVVLVVFAGQALADAIDGNWCHNDGCRFSIHGPTSSRLAESICRAITAWHYYTYVPPAAERGAGAILSRSECLGALLTID